MATIKDVAATAGVSTATISHYINDTRPISAETRRRIREAIATTGYRVNRLAKALRVDKSDAIGVVISDISNEFYGGVIQGIEDRCIEAGYSVFVSSSDDNPERENAAMARFEDHQVDGLIVSFTSASADRVLESLSSRRVPVVLVDRLVEADVDQVGSENQQSMRELVGHLIDRGHTSIGYISGIGGINTTEERLRGYQSAFDEAGITPSTDWVTCGQSRSGPAYAATIELLSAHPEVSALAVGNSSMMPGVMRALSQIQDTLSRPINVVGFDDSEWMGAVRPGITTMRQPTYEIGSEAARLMLRRLAEPGGDALSIRLNPEFMHRDSCGCEAGDER